MLLRSDSQSAKNIPSTSPNAAAAGPASSAPPVATIPSRLTAPYFVIGSWNAPERDGGAGHREERRDVERPARPRQAS